MAVRALESPTIQIGAIAPLNVNAVITDDRSGKKDPKTILINAPVALTEYQYILPSETRGFIAKLLLGKLYLRFNPLDDFSEISAGAAYNLERISPDASILTIYFKSTKDLDNLQVETWA